MEVPLAQARCPHPFTLIALRQTHVLSSRLTTCCTLIWSITPTTPVRLATSSIAASRSNSCLTHCDGRTPRNCSSAGDGSDRLPDGAALTAEDQALLEAFATSAATAVATARTVASELQRQRLAAAEGERGRWARELHDETLQSLAALRFTLSQAHRAADLQVLTEAVGQAIEDVEEGISSLRSLVTDLRPVALDDLGLEAALESLCERASRHGIEIDRSLDLAYEQGREPTRHTAELETAMYRIIQEALTNASKHGRARRAVIEILESETTVELSIRDDGDGFDPSISTAGFGLLGMRERVQLLDGEIEIESSPGNGTIVTASIPAQRRLAEAATPPVGSDPFPRASAGRRARPIPAWPRRSRQQHPRG